MLRYLISILISLILYNNNQSNELQTLDFDDFTLRTPKGWTKIKMRGIDAFIGGLTNGKDSIKFYFGWYINGLSKDETGNSQTIHEKINNKSAIIRFPKSGRPGTTEMFIDSANQMAKFAIWTDNMIDTNLSLRIFRSVIFKNQ